VVSAVTLAGAWVGLGLVAANCGAQGTAAAGEAASRLADAFASAPAHQGSDAGGLKRRHAGFPTCGVTRLSARYARALLPQPCSSFVRRDAMERQCRRANEPGL